MIKKLSILAIVFITGFFIGKNSTPSKNFELKKLSDQNNIEQIQQLLLNEDPDYSKIFLLLLAHLNLNHKITADEIKFVIDNSDSSTKFEENDDLQKTQVSESIQTKETKETKETNESLIEKPSETSTPNTTSEQSTDSQFSTPGPAFNFNEVQEFKMTNSLIKNLYKNALVMVEPIDFPIGDYFFKFESKRFTNAKNANLLNINNNLVHNGKYFEGEINMVLSSSSREISVNRASGNNTVVLLSEYKKTKKVLIEISDYIFVFSLKKKNSKQSVYLDQGLVYYKNNFEEVLKFTPLGKFHLVK